MKTRTKIVTIELERPTFVNDFMDVLVRCFEKKTIVIREPQSATEATPTSTIREGTKVKIMDGPFSKEIKEYIVTKRTDTYEITTTKTEKPGGAA